MRVCNVLFLPGFKFVFFFILDFRDFAMTSSCVFLCDSFDQGLLSLSNLWFGNFFFLQFKKNLAIVALNIFLGLISLSFI